MPAMDQDVDQDVDVDLVRAEFPALRNSAGLGSRRLASAAESPYALGGDDLCVEHPGYDQSGGRAPQVIVHHLDAHYNRAAEIDALILHLGEALALPKA